MCSLLVEVAVVYAQEAVTDDGEIKINPDALRELEQNTLIDPPKLQPEAAKRWMEFDETLPTQLYRETERKVVLTLRPYTANTKYNYNPVYGKKIKVGKDTWRSDPFYAITHPYGSKVRMGGGGKTSISCDLMAPLAHDFWRFRHKKNRARTLLILKNLY